MFDSVLRNNVIGIVSFASPITIQGTIIHRNGFGVLLTSATTSQGEKVDNCTFFSNERVALAVLNFFGFGLNDPILVEISDCHFFENLDTPIRNIGGWLTFSGENIIRGNRAVRGGGLALSNSGVIFSQGSKTQFTNNTALEYGGAVYRGSLSIAFLSELMAVLSNIVHLIQHPAFVY